MNKIIIIFIVIGIEVACADKLPISSIPFILRQNNPEGISLGLTGVAYQKGVYSSYTNPSGLAYISHFEIGISHIPPTQYLSRKKYSKNAINIGLKIGSLCVVGIEYWRCFLGKARVFYIDNYKSDEFENIYLNQYKISFAKLLKMPNAKINGGELALGLSMILIQKTHAHIKNDAYFLDWGIRFYQPISKIWFSVGFSFNNSQLSNNDLGLYLRKPVTYFRQGLAVGSSFHSLYFPDFLFTVEYQRSTFNDNWRNLGLGFEFSYLKFLYIRTGYNYDFYIYRDRYKHFEQYRIQGVTYGFGLEFELKTFAVPYQINFSCARGIKIKDMFKELIFSISIKVKK